MKGNDIKIELSDVSSDKDEYVCDQCPKILQSKKAKRKECTTLLSLTNSKAKRFKR